MATPTERGLTRDDLLALPAAIDVETASRAFGLGRTTGYALAKADKFPCKLIKAGRSYRVITADLLRVLEVTPESSNGVRGAAAPSDENAKESA